ncbi:MULTISPECIES: transposase [unclassified Streptomyces]|uniref:transposase n=1 Tax=Streptomyces sp. NBC_01549 TaxID=2975874 RepID=UPI002F90ADC0
MGCRGSVWDADRLRDAVRDYVITHLGNADASLVIDDTQAQKKGTRSVGVAFQHCGLTGDVRNCQAMVMLTYATTAGHAFIDRRLYLPADALRFDDHPQVLRESVVVAVPDRAHGCFNSRS